MWRSSSRARVVFTCNSTRRQCGVAPCTCSSPAHRSGTAPNPMSRAPVAGKLEMMSGVAVKMMLMMSSSTSWLRSMMARSSSWMRSLTWETSSASTVVAPRSARTAGGPGIGAHAIRPPSRTGPALALSRWPSLARFVRGDGQRPDIGHLERPPVPGWEARVREWSDPGPHQAEHRVAHRFAHPANEPVAPLVDDDAQHAGGDHPDRGGGARAVLQGDPQAQRPQGAGTGGALHLGQVLLGHAVARV